jgi:FkbM family methyltransferase
MTVELHPQFRDVLACGALRRLRTRRVGRSLAYRYGERLGRTRAVLVSRLDSGSEIVLSPHDRQHRHLFIYGSYEPEVAGLLDRLLGPGKVFFDVGANAGYFALRARDLGAEVHAFEPNPDVRALLGLSIARDGRGITANPEAVSRASRQVLTFYVSENGNTGMSSLERPTERSIDVTTIALDDYVERTGAHPDLVKIDVEGHQLSVLAGASQLLSAGHTDLVVEITSPEQVALLAGHGYVAYRLLPDGSLDGWDGYIPNGGFANLFFSRD